MTSAAPAFMARTVVDTSQCPATKITGMSTRSATRFSTSKPFRSGSAMSSTRQLGTSARGRERNSRPERNVSGCQPSDSMRTFRDSRAEGVVVDDEHDRRGGETRGLASG